MILTIEELIDEELTDPSILKEEVKKAMRTSKKDKAPGPEKVPMELFKLLNDNSLRTLVKMFNRIHEMAQ